MNVVVLELQRSDYRELSMASATELGEALAALPETIGVWVVEDGDPSLRGVARLQFAVAGRSGKDAAESVWPSVAPLQKKFRRRLAIAHFEAQRPDVIPPSVAERLGVEVTPNRATVVSVLKKPQ